MAVSCYSQGVSITAEVRIAEKKGALSTYPRETCYCIKACRLCFSTDLGLIRNSITAHGAIESGNIRSFVAKLPGIISAGRSDNTRRTCYHSYNQWEKWVVSNGCLALPANHVSVAAYMGQLITDRASFAKIHGVYFAINFYHVLGGYTSPCEEQLVRNIYDVAKRTCRKGFRRKQAFTVHELERIRTTLPVDSCLRSLRLWAMMLVMFAGSLRFDEVVGIRL